LFVCKISDNGCKIFQRSWFVSNSRLISWPWEITFVPLWIVLCISLVGVLYTVIFAGVILRMPEINQDQRRNSTNTALGNLGGKRNPICNASLFLNWNTRGQYGFMNNYNLMTNVFISHQRYPCLIYIQTLERDSNSRSPKLQLCTFKFQATAFWLFHF
jgi:hypothetical protein